MNIFKKFILLNFILLLVSCGTAKDAFTNQKKSSTDEFLVEKKSPLIMPPDYNELPVPKENTIEKKSEGNEIESLISKTNNQDNLPENSDGTNKNFEDLLLEKIKSN